MIQAHLMLLETLKRFSVLIVGRTLWWYSQFPTYLSKQFVTAFMVIIGHASACVNLYLTPLDMFCLTTFDLLEYYWNP